MISSLWDWLLVSVVGYMHSILMHWSQNAPTNMVLCYTVSASRRKDLTQGGAVFFFLNMHEFEADGHEVIHVWKHAEA